MGLSINCLLLYREVSRRYPRRKGGTKIRRARGSGWLPQTTVFLTPRGGSARELEVAMRACSGPAQGQARKESQQEGESGQEIPPLAVNYIETLTTMDDNWRESQLSSGMWPLRSYPDSKTWPHSQVDTGSTKRTLWVLKKIKKTRNWKKKKKRWEEFQRREWVGFGQNTFANEIFNL